MISLVRLGKIAAALLIWLIALVFYKKYTDFKKRNR